MAEYGYIYAPFSGTEEHGDTYAKTYRFYIYWEILSQNAAAGFTKLYLSWGLNKCASNTVTFNNSGDAELTARYDDTVLKDGGSVKFDMRNSYVGKDKSLFNKTLIIYHDATGRCSLPVYGYFQSGVSLGTAEASGTIELPVIPRDSFITATDAVIGKVSNVFVGHSYDSYKHSVKMEFGNLSGYLNASGEIVDTEIVFSETDIPFALPETFYNEIPNAASGTVKLTMTTYESGTKIGEAATTTFTASADKEVCAPEVSATLKDVDEAAKSLSGGSVFILNISDVAVVVTATPKNGASIASATINGVDVNVGATTTFLNSLYSAYTVIATDSRGISSAAVYSPAVVDYTLPVVNASGKRTDQTSGDVSLNISGRWWRGKFGTATSAKANALTVYYRARKSGGAWGEYTALKTVDADDISFTATVGGIDYRYTWEIEVKAEDLAATSSTVLSIPKGIPLFDWGEDDFHLNIPLSFSDDAKTGTREALGITEPEAVKPASILAWREIGSWGYNESLEADFTAYTEIMFVCDYYDDGFSGMGGGTMTIPVIALRDDVNIMYFGTRTFANTGFTVKMTTAKAESYGVYISSSTASGYKIYCYGR